MKQKEWYGDYVVVSVSTPPAETIGAAAQELLKLTTKRMESADWETLKVIVRKPGRSLNPFNEDQEEKEDEEPYPFWTVAVKVQGVPKKHDDD